MHLPDTEAPQILRIKNITLPEGRKKVAWLTQNLWFCPTPATISLSHAQIRGGHGNYMGVGRRRSV
jgi:hypothetical protein